MFRAKKAENSWEQAAGDVYRVLLMRALEPVFFKKYDVPDTFEGRFDLLLLHVFAVMHVSLKHGGADAEGFNQALFDVMFQDMDQSLREAGKGDMVVPKQMKRMMLAFNGRMNRYEEAFGEGAQAFKDAIAANVYGDTDVKAAHITALGAYIKNNIKAIEKAGADALFSGTLDLVVIKGL